MTILTKEQLDAIRAEIKLEEEHGWIDSTSQEGDYLDTITDLQEKLAQVRSHWALDHLELFTRGADGAPVVKIMIPSFRPRAEAIMLNSRFFIWIEERQRYEEGLCFPVPEFMVDRAAQ